MVSLVSWFHRFRGVKNFCDFINFMDSWVSWFFIGLVVSKVSWFHRFCAVKGLNGLIGFMGSVVSLVS